MVLHLLHTLPSSKGALLSRMYGKLSSSLQWRNISDRTSGGRCLIGAMSAVCKCVYVCRASHLRVRPSRTAFRRVISLSSRYQLVQLISCCKSSGPGILRQCSDRPVDQAQVWSGAQCHLRQCVHTLRTGLTRTWWLRIQAVTNTFVLLRSEDVSREIQHSHFVSSHDKFVERRDIGSEVNLPV